ncbi:MAG: 2-nitropropane dioxygenase, partial [Shewanella xiamenensis]|nr:2-nitropropane dioxygenase [Shewanella xiamenensis]
MTNTTLDNNALDNKKLSPWPWQVDEAAISFDIDSLGKKLKDLNQACYLVNHAEKGLGIAQSAEVVGLAEAQPCNGLHKS